MDTVEHILRIPTKFISYERAVGDDLAGVNFLFLLIPGENYPSQLATLLGSNSRRILFITGFISVLNCLYLGNPGIIEFYRDFMAQLSVELKRNFPEETIPIWGISHGGHQTGSHPFLPHDCKSPFHYLLDFDPKLTLK